MLLHIKSTKLLTAATTMSLVIRIGKQARIKTKKTKEHNVRMLLLNETHQISMLKS